MRFRVIIAFVGVAVPFQGAAWGRATAQDAAGSPSEVAVTDDVVERSKIPDVALAPVSGFDDDAAFVRSVTDRVASLEAMVAGESSVNQEAGSAPRRAATLLAGANLILARQIEPACSRRLLRIDRQTGSISHQDDRGVRDALDHADELLRRAEALLKESADPQTDSAKVSEHQTERDEAVRHAKALRAFSTGLRAYLLPANGDAALSGLRRAISALSPFIEDEDPSVSSSAALWQACLRSGESDIPRALSVLGLALETPAKGTMPYALFASIERCRLLAEQGGRATALALLMQVEGRCEEWISETKQQSRAVRVVQLAQMQILEDWFDQIGSDEAGEGQASGEGRVEKKWCADRIRKLAEEEFDEKSNSLFRLGEAIPIIAEPPQTGKKADQG